MDQLTDNSPMPFGKFQGRHMVQVPAAYLHWLWSNGIWRKHDANSEAVSAYIRTRLSALKKEHSDGIWEKH